VSTQTIDKVDIDPITGEPRCTHIVPGDDKHTGVELVMQARINGTEVTALCGHRWVPQHKAGDFPLCSKCKEIYDKTSEDLNLGPRDPWEGIRQS